MELLGKILSFIVLLVSVAIILAWPVQLLWNSCLVGAVDGIHPIGFLQALGLVFLSSALFKSNSNSN
jgi:hypothetical protein